MFGALHMGQLPWFRHSDAFRSMFYLRELQGQFLFEWQSPNCAGMRVVVVDVDSHPVSIDEHISVVTVLVEVVSIKQLGHVFLRHKLCFHHLFSVLLRVLFA